MACSNILEIAPDSPVRKTSWVISKLSVYEHVHKKMVRNAILQLLYLQMIMLHCRFLICTVHSESTYGGIMLLTAVE